MPNNRHATFKGLDAHHRIGVSSLSGIATFLLLHGHLENAMTLVASWDAFATVELALAWTVMLRADPLVVRRNVRLQDTGRSVIFLLVLLAAVAAFVAVAFVLGPARSLGGFDFALHFPLSLLAVADAWILVHTLFALRYAHVYYTGHPGDESAPHQGGLLFPGSSRPDFVDFAYFSFVIGMTSQVSDVQITGKRMRRLALVHGVLSFAFNTAILALAINVLASFV